MSPRVAWAACVAMAGLGVAAELTKPATSDMGLFLYAAGRMLHGARLYRDIVDLNPPLIFAANIPVVLLSRATGLPEFLMYSVCGALLVGMLLLYSGRLLFRYALPEDAERARYVLLLLCFALFLLPGFDFGEREHFVLGLLVPYLLLTTAACAGRKVPTGDAVVVGLLAGAAIGFKPHFALVCITLEAVRRVHGPRADRWRPTPAVAGVLAFLLAYGAALLWLTPGYLAVVSLLGPAYSAWLREPFLNLLVLGPGVPLAAFALLAFLALRRAVRTPTLVTLLAWATVAALAAGAAQEKSFRYHFYPAMGFGLVLLGLVAADAGRAGERLVERIYRRTSRAVLATVVVFMLGYAARDAAGLNAAQRAQWAEIAEMVGKVRAMAGGRPVGVLSYTTGSAFPLVNYAHVGLASRFPSFWATAAFYWDAIATGGPLTYRRLADMGPAERYFLTAVREDLKAAQPKLLVVLRPGRDAAVNGQRRLQLVQYLGRDPEIAALLARYHLTERVGEYLLYERGEAGSASTGPPPSAAPGTLDVVKAQLADFRFGALDQETLAGLALLVVCWVSVAGLERRGAGS